MTKKKSEKEDIYGKNTKERALAGPRVVGKIAKAAVKHATKKGK